MKLKTLLLRTLLFTFSISIAGSSTFTHVSPISHCVIAGTIIYTPAGPKKIEDIAKQEMIWTLNERTNRLDQSKVLGIQKNDKQSVYEVKFEKQTVTVTADHPFYGGGSFYSIQSNQLYGVPTQTLKVGQKIRCIENNRWIDQRVVSIKKVKKKMDTYAISKVETNRIYFTNSAASLVETIPSTFALNR